jgi:hypothetical protein
MVVLETLRTYSNSYVEIGAPLLQGSSFCDSLPLSGLQSAFSKSFDHSDKNVSEFKLPVVLPHPSSHMHTVQITGPFLDSSGWKYRMRIRVLILCVPVQSSACGFTFFKGLD